MPSIAMRGEQMPPSPIRKLVPFAEAAKARGTTVYHLNIGQPDIPTPQALFDVVRNMNMEVLEYSHSAGNESYRLKLAEYYSRNGISLNEHQIIITSGGSEAILFAMMTCCDPGDEIIVPEPFYANYNGFSTASGVNIIPITSSIENGFALPPMEKFEEAITARTRAILICNPNNPTGYLYSLEELNVLKEICLKHDLFLFSDEAYREFCYDGQKHISALSLEGMGNHTILLDTISKRYSACGARIGAFATHNAEVLHAAMKFAQARLSPATIEQLIGEAAVDLPENYFHEVHAEYTKRRDVLISRLNAMPGVFCPNPGGAFYAMAKLPVDNTEKFCLWLLEKFNYKGATIMMAPASGFYSTPGRGNDEVRLAYVLNIKNINAAMDCLEVALKEYNN